MASGTLFTYGPSNVDSLLATTLSQVNSELSDSIFNVIPLWGWLNKKARVTKDGGASIVQPTMYAKSTAAGSYSGYQLLDTTPQEGLTAAQFKWKKYYASITIAGDEEMQNSGESQVISLLQTKIKQARESLLDQLVADLFASTQNSAKIGALPVFVDATSTVGDINSTTNSWWQANVTASGSFATRGRSDWTTGYNTVTLRGRRATPPDVGVTTQTLMEAYESTLVPQIRYAIAEGAPNTGDAGFASDSLKFKGLTLLLDPNVPSGEAYFLNSDHLKLYTHSKRNLTASEFVRPANQDARTSQLLWMGDIVTDNRRKLQKFTGMTA